MDLHVDRLTLRLAGLTEVESRHVGRLVVEYLARAQAPASGRATSHVGVSVTPQPGESLDSMARRIAQHMASAVAGPS